MPPFDMVTMARGIWAESAVVSVNGLAIAPVTEIEDVACCDHAGNATASMTPISFACRTAQNRFIKPHFKRLPLTCMVLYTTLSPIKDKKYLSNSVMNTKVDEGGVNANRKNHCCYRHHVPCIGSLECPVYKSGAFRSGNGSCRSPGSGSTASIAEYEHGRRTVDVQRSGWAIPF